MSYTKLNENCLLTQLNICAKQELMPKYKVVMDDIQRQKKGFQAAKDNPQEYLQAIMRAKMNGDIR